MRLRRTPAVAGLLLVLPALLAGLPATPARAGAAPAHADHRPAQPGAGGFAAAVDAVLEDPRLDGAQAGVVVRAADTGEVLYARDGDRRMIPASTQKLLTSAAALHVLGPDYRFATQVLAAGVQHAEVLDGDLHLRGTGDPTLQAADYRRLAAEVAARGIRVVSGGLVADDTWFDDVRLGPDWSWEDEEYGYAAQISALTVAAEPDGEPGTIIVEVSPDAAPPTVVTRPPTRHVTVVNRAVTGPAGSPQTVTITREHGTNTITVEGSIPADAPPMAVRRSVWDPTGYAAEVFADALADHGIRLLGATGLGGGEGGGGAFGQAGIRRGSTPEGAWVVGGVRSASLRELVVPMLKRSVNGYAEVLVKAMGREVRGEGTTAAGVDVLRDALAALGVDTAGLRAVDGSGLSRQNLVMPEHLAALLSNAQEEVWFPAWYAALPVAGARGALVGGTLEGRMAGGPAAFNVRAKTGTLTAVSALVGYVTNADGRRLAFVVLLNHYLGDSPKDLEDRIAAALAASTEATISAVARADAA